MKRIIACINEKKYLDILVAFCKQEKFLLIPINPHDDLGQESFILFITDDVKCLNNFKLESQNVCIISDEKQVSKFHFSLKTDFSVVHLRLLLDAIYHGSIINNYLPSLMPDYISKTYKLANDYDNIDKIACAMTYEFAYFFTFSDLEKTRIGLSEMITNAMEHGNLNITNNEKMISTENGTYYDLLKERLVDPRYKDREVHVSIEFLDGVLTINIKDEGEGFDTSKIPDPTDTERLLKLHGRGILIARIYFNEIVYSAKGNEVTLVKKMCD